MRVPSRTLALAALIAAGCKNESEPGYYGTLARHGHSPRTLYINNGDEPEYLDPGLISEQAGASLVMDLFEGLVDQHPRDLHPVQGVAERYDKSDDNRLYRFYLRDGAKWSDGKPVVAQDFVYAWQRVLRPETGSRVVSLLEPLKNGMLFNQRQVLVLREDQPLRPSAAASGGKKLAAGTAVKLASKPDAAGMVEVEVFTDLPTFRPAKPPAAAAEKGWLPREKLELDPSILGMRAVGDRVIEVELERATPFFLELVSYHAYFPVRRDVVEKGKDEDRWTRPENIVTNGPFVLTRHAFRYELVFDKNPNYWAAGDLRVDRIVWLEVPSYDATLALYKGGEIDYIGSLLSLPEKHIPMLRAYRDFSEAPWQSSYWYEMNVEKPPLTDRRVRIALDLAVDKAQIIARVTHGQQQPSSHYVPDFTGSGYDAAVAADRAAGADPFARPEWQFNPERARQLLGEAGFPVAKKNGRWHAEGFPGVEILYNGAPGATSGHPAIAVAIQSMWQDNLGVSATLRNEEWKVALKNMRDGNYQIARLGWSADYNHPHTYLETFLSTSPNNWTRWRDPAFDELVEKAAAAGDPQASMKLYRQAELRALEAMPRLPIYFYTKSSLAKPYLRGFYPNGMNRHPVHWMWLDADWRSHPDNEPAYPPRELPPPGKFAP